MSETFVRVVVVTVLDLVVVVVDVDPTVVTLLISACATEVNNLT